jgi:RNA polymerase sigma factor (sigma-70 family)
MHATPSMEDILQEYGPAMRRLCASYLPPGPAREDLEQDILLAIYRALPYFRHDASLRTFLYRIAHRCALRSRVQLAAHHASQEDPSALDLSPGPDPSPEHLTILKQRQEQLAGALRKLPLSQRQPLTMRLNGLSYQEIADVLGLDLPNVTIRIHRGTAALKSLMQKEHSP